MADTKIRFSAEGVQGIHSEMERLIADAKSINSIWEESGDRILKNLRDQINLLDQRNQKFSELNRGISSQSTSGIQQSSIQDEQTSQSLRDLVNNFDTFLETLQEGGIKLTDDSIKSLVEGFSGEGGPISGRERIRQAEEQSNFSSFLQKFGLTSVIRTVNSQDPTSALTGLSSNIGNSLMQVGGKAGAAGAILSALTEIFGAQYNVVKETAPEAARSARIFGGDYLGYVTRDAQYERYGFQRADVLQQQNNLARALGTGQIGNNLDEALLYQRGKDLSQDDILSLARAGRGNPNFSIGGTISTLSGNLAAAGVSRGLTSSEAFSEVDARIPEYLRILTDLSQEQLDLLGSVDVGINSALVGALSAIPSLSNPSTLRGVMNSIQDNLRNANTPQLEALQFQTLAQLNPGGSLWDLQKMRGGGLQTRDYFSTYIQNLQNRSVGTEDAAWNVWGALLGGQSGREQIAEDLVTHGIGTEAWNRAFEEATKTNLSDQEFIASRLDQTVSAIDRNTAMWEGMKIGESVEGIRNLLDGISKVLTGIDDGVKYFKNNDLAPKGLKESALATAFPAFWFAPRVARLFTGNGGGQ